MNSKNHSICTPCHVVGSCSFTKVHYQRPRRGAYFVIHRIVHRVSVKMVVFWERENNLYELGEEVWGWGERGLTQWFRMVCGEQFGINTLKQESLDSSVKPDMLNSTLRQEILNIIIKHSSTLQQEKWFDTMVSNCVRGDSSTVILWNKNHRTVLWNLTHWTVL